MLSPNPLADRFSQQPPDHSVQHLRKGVIVRSSVHLRGPVNNSHPRQEIILYWLYWTVSRESYEEEGREGSSQFTSFVPSCLSWLHHNQIELMLFVDGRGAGANIRWPSQTFFREFPTILLTRAGWFFGHNCDSDRVSSEFRPLGPTQIQLVGQWHCLGSPAIELGDHQSWCTWCLD